MANIGSAFLGDLQAKRIRQLSSPTGSIVAPSPPSSPSATATHPSHRMNIPLSPPPPPSQSLSHSLQKDDQAAESWAALERPPKKTTIDPILALELRVRWLEALVQGPDGPPPNPGASTSAVKTAPDKKVKFADEKGRGKLRGSRGRPSEILKERERESGEGTAATLARLTENVQKRLDTIVEANDGLRKFMDTYDQHAQFLTPTFALSGIIDVPLPSTPTSEDGDKTIGSTLLPLYQNMSPQEIEAYFLEMEPDIRAADRDMREIEVLVGKGVTGAGKLGDYEALRPRLARLIQEHEEDVKLADELERRVAKLVERNATHIDALSELFVAWDDALLEAESRTNRLERDGRERKRLGLVP